MKCWSDNPEDGVSLMNASGTSLKSKHRVCINYTKMCAVPRTFLLCKLSKSNCPVVNLCQDE